MALVKASAVTIDAMADTPLRGVAFPVFGLTVFSLQDVIIKILCGRRIVAGGPLRPRI